jgi:hypothetical protein
MLAARRFIDSDLVICSEFRGAQASACFMICNLPVGGVSGICFKTRITRSLVAVTRFILVQREPF